MVKAMNTEYNWYRKGIVPVPVSHRLASYSCVVLFMSVVRLLSRHFRAVTGSHLVSMLCVTHMFAVPPWTMCHYSVCLYCVLKSPILLRPVSHE